LVKAGFEAQPFADDRHQHIDGDGDSDLSLHRVVAGAVEGFDAQVLLDPFEQQGDILPINIIVPMKSRFTILFTRCARIGYR
jgi:hypothetical protein